MNISTAGIALIKHFESLRLEAYQDSVGIWTIGWGHTEGVQPKQIITSGKAEEYLSSDIRRFEAAVTNLVKRPIKQAQFDSLTSFAFNLGQNALATSTLLKKLNAGDDPSNEFLKWCLAGGKALPGLVLRRMAERLLYLGRDWSVIL